MRLGRLLSVLVLAGTLAACTSGGGTPRSLALARVCGYEFLPIGPLAEVQTRPAAETTCPVRGSISNDSQQAVTVSDTDTGKTYVLYPIDLQGPWGYWTAMLPAGNYIAVGWACPSTVGTRFSLKPGAMLRSVKVRRGCLVS